MREATDRFQAGDTDLALEILQDHLSNLRESSLEADRVALLRKPVESRLQQFKIVKAQCDFEKLQSNQHETGSQMISRITQAEEEQEAKRGRADEAVQHVRTRKASTRKPRC